jgi:hypothetical protein
MRLVLEKKWSGERIDKLVEILSKSRLAADQAMPMGAEKLRLVWAWAEVLADLSLEELDGYYEKASRSKTNGFAVTALDMVAERNRDLAVEHTETRDNSQERRKVLGWKVLADSTRNLPTPGTPCEYPGCTLLCLSRYCIVHGEQIGPYFHSTLKPEYRPKLVETEDDAAPLSLTVNMDRHRSTQNERQEGR